MVVWSDEDFTPGTVHTGHRRETGRLGRGPSGLQETNVFLSPDGLLVADAGDEGVMLVMGGRKIDASARSLADKTTSFDEFRQVRPTGPRGRPKALFRWITLCPNWANGESVPLPSQGCEAKTTQT